MSSPVDDALVTIERCIDWREGRGHERAAAALATVRQEVERLTKERGELGQAWVNAEERLRAAEVEVQRLTEERDAGLRLTLTRIGHAPWCKCDICAPTRELLGGRP